MKFTYPTILVLAMTLIACRPKPTITIENDSEFAITGKRVVLSRKAFDGLDGTYFKLIDHGQELPVQFDDPDGDGQWDELVFEIDLKPQVASTLSIEGVSEAPTYEQKTQVYLGVSPDRNEQFSEQNEAVRPKDHEPQSLPYLYQYEGPGWESDLVAFRSYFDRRNGKDIFGKTKPQLYVDNIGLSENYHELGDWGMDVLKVGNSLGSGALALLKNDSLYRLGETGTASYKVIAEGPVRSVFELNYTGWEVAGVDYDITEQIAIWAGKRSFQSAVTLSPNSADTLVTGIVNLKKVGEHQVETDGYHILYTHGVQSENKDVLGMGLLVPEENFVAFDEADSMNSSDVSDTYTALLKQSESGKFLFHFVAGWELENAEFENQGRFEEALVEEARELNAEVIVSIQ